MDKIYWTSNCRISPIPDCNYMNILEPACVYYMVECLYIGHLKLAMVEMFTEISKSGCVPSESHY